MWAQRAVCLLLVCVTSSARPGWAYPPARDIDRGSNLEANEAGVEPAVPVGWPEEQTFVHKRACNTATCATQRLMDFLSRARGMEGASPTDTGAGTFGRRRR